MELTARYAEVEVDVMPFFIVEANKQICIRKIQIQIHSEQRQLSQLVATFCESKGLNANCNNEINKQIMQQMYRYRYTCGYIRYRYIYCAVVFVFVSIA